jgi:hypothetical protein
MSDAAANQPKPLEIVSSVSVEAPRTRHSKSSVVSPESAPCVGKVGPNPAQAPKGREKNRAPSKKARALREALHAAVEAFCDILDESEPERRVAARVVAVRPDDRPPADSDRAAAKAIVKGWIK